VVEGAELGRFEASGVRFETAALKGVDLAGSRVPGLGLTHSLVVDCNLSNVHARGADFYRVVVERSRMTGIELAEGTLQDVTVRGCKVDMASFGFARLARVTFEDCLMAGAEFLEARLDSVRFEACDLSGADFRGATLGSCELRRCDLAELRGVERLRGAALEWHRIVEMAGVWAAALGIDVLED
jgi:uncharacterized protein YjbI with pentapeptide repeats